MKTKLLILRAASLALVVFATPPSVRADVVTGWNAQMERAIKTNAVSAALQARVCAIVSAAVYDAVNGLALTYQPYFVHERGPTGARQDAAAVQAAYTSLVSLFPTQAVTFDAALVTSLAQLPDAQTQSNAIATGRAWGESVAQRILAWRAQDGLTNPTPNYFGGTNVGQWRSISTGTNADGTLPAIVPQMPTLVPFTMTSPSQFRPGPPYGMPLAQALASPEYARDLNEVKAIGRVDSTNRTVDQTALARLWQASSAAELNNCLRQVLPMTNSLADNARLFALANFVAADGVIVGFDSKYTYNFWRPHHAIRFADLDGNPVTEADPEWSGLILAPRHQEYISNHAVHSGGFAYMVRRLLGDAHTFTLGSVDFPSFTWTFHSWSEVMSQVKEARIWGGIHYRNSCDAGERAGQSLADYVLDNFLGRIEPTTFTKITNGPVATDLGVSGGTVWADFNNDGFLDLYVAQIRRSGANYFYRNNGDGTFTRITQGSFLNGNEANNGVSAADYDNDGHLDLIVVSCCGSTAQGVVLFHNNGNGTFTRASSRVITNPAGYFSTGQWADYDSDGFVDLLIANVMFGEARNFLWHNNGDGTFARVTSGPIVSDSVWAWAASWNDYDNDGLIDLLVLNPDGRGSYLYHNDGGGEFSKVLEHPIVSERYSGFAGSAADWGDYDNDGRSDLFVTGGDSRRHHLYHNDGSGSFSDVDVGSLLVFSNSIGGRSAAWGDFDNDGYLDLLVSYPDHNSLYRNNHDGTFSEVDSAALASDTLSGDESFFNTSCWVDYDNDGFLDLHVTAGNVNDRPIPSVLYHNSGNHNSWLEVKCVGTVANRSAIGSKIRVKATIGGQTFWQLRELSTGGSWTRATPLVGHFGLGDATNVQTVRIEWPSGTVQELHNVAPRQILTITEPPRLSSPRLNNGRFAFTLRGGRGLQYGIQLSTNAVDWMPAGSLTVTNANGNAEFDAPRETAAPLRLYRAIAP